MLIKYYLLTFCTTDMSRLGIESQIFRSQAEFSNHHYTTAPHAPYRLPTQWRITHRDMVLNKSAINNDPDMDSLEGLAVIDDGDHVLDVTLRKLTVRQVLVFVGEDFVSVSEYKIMNGIKLKNLK